MEIMRKIQYFLPSEEGATATEYAVMITLIILVAIATIIILGQTVTNLFTEFTNLVGPYLSGGS